MPPPQKVRLGDLLIQQGLLTDEQLKIALDEQKRTGRKLGRVFVESGYVTEEGISQALARQLRIPFVDLKNFTPNPVPTDRILGIHHHSQMGQKILHMRGFDKLDPAPLHERQPTTRQLDFQIEGMKAGTKQHRNLIQRHTFFAQFQNFLRHKSRLCILPGCLHQRRQRPVQLTREQMFRIFLGSFLNDLIRDAQDRLRAARDESNSIAFK